MSKKDFDLALFFLIYACAMLSGIFICLVSITIDVAGIK